MAKQTKAELIQQIERESEELKLKLADITHTYNKTEQESSKHYEVSTFFHQTMTKSKSRREKQKKN